MRASRPPPARRAPRARRPRPQRRPRLRPRCRPPTTRGLEVATEPARPTPAARDGRPAVGAAVDIGSNSVHVLVAAVAGHRLQPLVDESVFLGLGSAIGARGYLGRAARGELTATLVRYADTARRLGATDIVFIGTEPIRRAADGASIVAEVGAATGVGLDVLTHEEEAYLTVIGVMEGQPVVQRTLVVDIGGGSSEFVIVDPTDPPAAVGLRLGSARLTDAHVSHDPPTTKEVDAMRDAARAAVVGAPDTSPQEIVAVGGTASNLVKILPAAALDRILTRKRVAEALAVLGSEPSAAAAERHLLNPVRSRILPAGAAIMDAVLERYGLDRIRVSEAGIREGAVLASQYDPIAWRDRLAVLAHGWRV